MAAADTSPDKLSLVVFSGGFDKVHYALAMAAAALAVNKPATLFFTMGAARALLACDNKGRPGWHGLHPTEDGLSPADAEANLLARKLGGFEELLSACAALGGTIMVCEMGLKALGLDHVTLRDDITIAPGGLVTFLSDASRQGAVVFI